MKLTGRLFLTIIMVVAVQTANVFGQLEGANLAAHGVLALVGGSREKNRRRLLINLPPRKR